MSGIYEKPLPKIDALTRGFWDYARAGKLAVQVCDACGGPPDPKRGMHFDHCHKHGHFRGWLCRECNLALGNVRDDPARLLKLVAYLKRTSRKASDQFSLPGV